MAIYSYQSENPAENGETLWRVYVNVRSKIIPEIRAQRKVSGLKSEKDALREETKIIRECEREVFEKESQGQTWGAIVDAFEEDLKMNFSQNLHLTTRLDYVAALRKHTTQWWRRSAASITKREVKEVLYSLTSQGGSHSHVNRVKVAMNRAFDFGIESGMVRGLDFSPAYGIRLEKQPEKVPEILTLSEIKKLLEAAKELNDPWYLVWAVALLTGMRNGEIYALCWSDVDWEANAISVNKSYNNRLKAIKSTKAGYWRTVPMSSELRSFLTDLKSKSGGRDHVLERNWKWTNGLQARELRKFCIGLSITSVRFHALRACFATQLIRSGVPPIQIQKICGWRDLKTMQRYIRLAGIEIQGATESLKVLPDVAVLEKATQLFT